MARRPCGKRMSASRRTAEDAVAVTLLAHVDGSIVRTAVPSAELLCPHLVLQHTIPYERIEPWRHVRMSELSSRTPRIRDGKQSRRSAKSATTWPLRSTSP